MKKLEEKTEVNTSERELKCKDLVQSKFQNEIETLNDILTLKNDFEHYEDYIQALIEYGLDFSFVEPETFTGQTKGYYRWQLSWGGPSDEFRIFMNDDNEVEKIQYWYMDWFDGASVECTEEKVNENWSLKELIYSHFIQF